MSDKVAGFRVGERRNRIDRTQFIDSQGRLDYAALMNKFDEVGERILEESKLIRRS